MKISILIPAYNEERTLPLVMDKLAQLPLEFEAVIVDDGSKDGTMPWLKTTMDEGKYSFPIRVFSHPVNQGKGAAIRTAISKAAGEILIIQDADLEYDPVYIPEIVKPILEGRADFVYGSRLSTRKSETYNVVYLWGNQFLTWLTNFLCSSRYTDSYTGYKAFKKEVLESITLTAHGFELEAELSVKLAMSKWRFEEVPISYKSRSRGEGKKINGGDAVKGILTIIKTWNSERAKKTS